MAKTPAILTQALKNFGKAGEVVQMKRGYLRYLQNIGRAMPATKSRLKALEENQETLKAMDEQRRAHATEMVEKLGEYKITLHRHASSKGVLFGKMGTRDISRALQEKGIDVSADLVRLPAQIQNVGNYNVDVFFHPDVPLRIQVEVIGQERKN